jgi:hypothetical protein
MNWHYLRALIFSIAMALIAFGIYSPPASSAEQEEVPPTDIARPSDSPPASSAEQEEGNIGRVISALQYAQKHGAKDVVVVITSQGDGPPDKRVLPIDAAGIIQANPQWAGILVILGRET